MTQKSGARVTSPDIFGLEAGTGPAIAQGMASQEALRAEPMSLHNAIQSWRLAFDGRCPMPVSHRKYLADHDLIMWDGQDWAPTTKGKRLGLQ